MHTEYRLVLYDTADLQHVALCVVEFDGARPVALRDIDTSGYPSGQALVAVMTQMIEDAERLPLVRKSEVAVLVWG